MSAPSNAAIPDPNSPLPVRATRHDGTLVLAAGDHQAKHQAKRNRADGGSAGNPVNSTTSNRGANRKASNNVNINRNTNINRNVNVNRSANVNGNYNHGYNDHHGGHHYYNDHGHYYDEFWNPVTAAAAITATAIVVGAVVNSVPPSCSTVVVNAISYSQCGSTWYQPQYADGATHYVVVNAPQ